MPYIKSWSSAFRFGKKKIFSVASSNLMQAGYNVVINFTWKEYLRRSGWSSICPLKFTVHVMFSFELFDERSIFGSFLFVFFCLFSGKNTAYGYFRECRLWQFSLGWDLP